MSFAVNVDPEAEREWQEAVFWYGEGDVEAGHRLNVAIRDVLRKIAQEPERFARVTELTRKVKVPQP
jgi:hypothetical protein